jgi:hypothetical protein
MRSCLLLSAAFMAIALTSCENQDAANHRNAVKTIETASASLREVPALSDQAITRLKSIAKSLRGVRSVSRELKATQYRLLTQIDLQLAGHLQQSAAASRTKAIEASNAIDSLSSAAMLQKGRIGQRASTPDTLGSDALADTRMATVQAHQGLQRQHDQQKPNIDRIRAANAAAGSEVLAMRTKAAQLLAEAAGVNAIMGQPKRAEAAGLEHRAAMIEAEIERRDAEVELRDQMDLDHIAIRTDGAAQTVDVLDGEISRVQSLANERRNFNAAGEKTLADMSTRLADLSDTLIDLLTGPLADNYQETTAALQQAAQSADKVKGERGSKDTDQLAKVQTQVALMNVANSRATMLAHSMRVLGAVADLGLSPGANKWSETRQVLQQDWESADTSAADARAEAISFAGSLGGDISATLLSQLDGSPPPPQENAPPAQDEGSDTGDSSADAALTALASELAKISALPQADQVARIRPLLDCAAPAEPCAMLDLVSGITVAVKQLVEALSNSPLANDPGAAMVIQMMSAMAGEDNDGGMSATVGDVRTTAPGEAMISINMTDAELGITITLDVNARSTSDGWKIMDLPTPGQMQTTVEEMRGILTGLNGITAKLNSGKIATAAALQQAAMSLMPG